MTDTTLKPLALEAAHEALGARFAPFAGHRMPLQYAGTRSEHKAVRERAGIFDVSHMGVFFVEGPDAIAAVDRIVTNDVGALPIDKALYTVMCNERGGIIDDLIVYRLATQRLMIIVNAGTLANDRAHIIANLQGDATFTDQSDDFVLLALQGPKAAEILDPLLVADLSTVVTYGVTETTWAADATPIIAARTGYTGEDGFEVLIPVAAAASVFSAIMSAGEAYGLEPAGLGARDTLRLEAKYSLYTQDISLETNPIEAGLGWVVKANKPSPFIGDEALRTIRKEGVTRRLRGITLNTRGVLRPGYPLFVGDEQIGTLTSGSMSITLGHAIGIGYIDLAHANDEEGVEVEIRGRRLPVSLTKKPFYRRP